MANGTTTFKNSRLSKLLFLSSIIVFVYWSLSRIINVYRFAVVGAIYEILWLFMILLLFGLPVMALIFLIKEKFNFRSLYLYTIIIVAINILLMVSI
jgi:hypothetical protein